MIVLNLNALKWNVIAQRIEFLRGMFQENFNSLFQLCLAPVMAWKNICKISLDNLMGIGTLTNKSWLKHPLFLQW